MDGYEELEDVVGSFVSVGDYLDIPTPDEPAVGLINKYVIATFPKNKKPLYYVDPNLRAIISSKYWSIYLSNSLGFDTVSEAKKALRNLKYNSPEIYKVNRNGSLRGIY